MMGKGGVSSISNIYQFQVFQQWLLRSSHFPHVVNRIKFRPSFEGYSVEKADGAFATLPLSESVNEDPASFLTSSKTSV